MRAGLSALLCLASVACGQTEDTLGNEREHRRPPLRQLEGPASYANPFRDVLGKTDAQISKKLEDAFEQLFHGDPATEAIYFTVGEDQAYIQDILHGDVRSEGMGLGMLIAVELDKQDEFDRLWRYAKAALQYSSGARRGYFRSSCDSSGEVTACADPYGHQFLLTSLLFAHGRWGSAGDVDYQTDFWSVHDVMLEKESENGGVVDGVTNLFDSEAKLVVDVPENELARRTRASSVMPAFYELWRQATGVSFWRDAAEYGRAFLTVAGHAETGLYPVRSAFDGEPFAGSDTFRPESYRAHLNVALDGVWFGESWAAAASDTILAFFAEQGSTYGTAYSLSGDVLDPAREVALVFMNAALAASSSLDGRDAFIETAWALPQPSGQPRYYAGLLHLVTLLTLSGQLRVY